MVAVMVGSRPEPSTWPLALRRCTHRRRATPLHVVCRNLLSRTHACAHGWHLSPHPRRLAGLFASPPAELPEGEEGTAFAVEYEHRSAEKLDRLAIINAFVDNIPTPPHKARAALWLGVVPAPDGQRRAQRPVVFGAGVAPGGRAGPPSLGAGGLARRAQRALLHTLSGGCFHSAVPAGSAAAWPRTGGDDHPALACCCCCGAAAARAVQVNLKGATKTIIVQMVRNACGVSVVTRYRELNKFNLRKCAEVRDTRSTLRDTRSTRVGGRALLGGPELCAAVSRVWARWHRAEVRGRRRGGAL